MKLLIAMVTLAGCAGISVDDRMDLAMQCGMGDECDLLWDEYNTASARQDRRNARRMIGNCGSGMVLYCNANCMATRKSGDPYGACVPLDSFNF